MKSLSVLAGLCGFVSAAATPQVTFGDVGSGRIPTMSESAVMGRRILALSSLATFSTVFPNASSNRIDSYQDTEALYLRPDAVTGVPVGLMDYVADCEDHGNPTVLAITIGTSFKNVRDGSNLTISMRWSPPGPLAKTTSVWSRLSDYISFGSRQEPSRPPYSAASLPRFSLFGYLEPISAVQLKTKSIVDCYLRTHGDAKTWLPGNPIHTSEWMRFVVTNVYWVGGFGDRAYIGWIPVEEWSSVTRKQWQAIRLPGEEGESGWSGDTVGDV